jgi:hypothetical protein
VSPIAPTAPGNLTAVAATQNDQEGISLEWDNDSNNETGFTIERSTRPDFSADAQTFTVQADVTTYFDDSGLTAGVMYYYKVGATNAAATTPVYGSRFAQAELPPELDFILVGEDPVQAGFLGKFGIYHMNLALETGGTIDDSIWDYSGIPDGSVFSQQLWQSVYSGGHSADGFELEPYKEFVHDPTTGGFELVKVSDILEDPQYGSYVEVVYSGTQSQVKAKWQQIQRFANAYPWAEHFKPPMPPAIFWQNWPNSEYESTGNNSNCFIRWLRSVTSLNFTESNLPGRQPGNARPGGG